MSESRLKQWFTIDTIAVGNSAIGLVAAGTFNSVALVAVSFLNAMGLVAIGGLNATGVIAIAGGTSRSALPV